MAIRRCSYCEELFCTCCANDDDYCKPEHRRAAESERSDESAMNLALFNRCEARAINRDNARGW